VQVSKYVQLQLSDADDVEYAVVDLLLAVELDGLVVFVVVVVVVVDLVVLLHK
jgi:hypothetical protein